MTVDPNTALAVLQLVAMLIGFTVTFTKLGGRVDMVSMRVKTLEADFIMARDYDKRLALIEQRQGSHGQLIATTNERVEHLARGDGFIIRPDKFADER